MTIQQHQEKLLCQVSGTWKKTNQLEELRLVREYTRDNIERINDLSKRVDNQTPLTSLLADEYAKLYAINNLMTHLCTP